MKHRGKTIGVLRPVSQKKPQLPPKNFISDLQITLWMWIISIFAKRKVGKRTKAYQEESGRIGNIISDPSLRSNANLVLVNGSICLGLLHPLIPIHMFWGVLEFTESRNKPSLCCALPWVGVTLTPSPSLSVTVSGSGYGWGNGIDRAGYCCSSDLKLGPEENRVHSGAAILYVCINRKCPTNRANRIAVLSPKIPQNTLNQTCATAQKTSPWNGPVSGTGLHGPNETKGRHSSIRCGFIANDTAKHTESNPCYCPKN